MTQFVTVAKIGEIPEGRSRCVVLGEHRVSVFFVAGNYYAIDDYCPHMGAPLSTGDIRDGSVVCDRHLWAFRLSDGVCVDAPTLKARTFETRVVGEEIQVRLPETS